VPEAAATGDAPRDARGAPTRSIFDQQSKGSHHYRVHASDPSRRTTVAVHPGDLPERDVRDILKQSRISREEFLKLL